MERFGWAREFCVCVRVRVECGGWVGGGGSVLFLPLVFFKASFHFHFHFHSLFSVLFLTSRAQRGWPP